MKNYKQLLQNKLILENGNRSVQFTDAERMAPERQNRYEVERGEVLDRQVQLNFDKELERGRISDAQARARDHPGVAAELDRQDRKAAATAAYDAQREQARLGKIESDTQASYAKGRKTGWNDPNHADFMPEVERWEYQPDDDGYFPAMSKEDRSKKARENLQTDTEAFHKPLNLYVDLIDGEKIFSRATRSREFQRSIENAKYGADQDNDVEGMRRQMRSISTTMPTGGGGGGVGRGGGHGGEQSGVNIGQFGDGGGGSNFSDFSSNRSSNRGISSRQQRSNIQKNIEQIHREATREMRRAKEDDEFDKREMDFNAPGAKNKRDYERTRPSYELSNNMLHKPSKENIAAGEKSQVDRAYNRQDRSDEINLDAGEKSQVDRAYNRQDRSDEINLDADEYNTGIKILGIDEPRKMVFNPNGTIKESNHTHKKSLKYFAENILHKYVKEEVVNPGNQPMTKGEITKRDKIAKKTKPRPIKGDTPEESKHRIATWITLRNKKKKGKD